jgi:hypothetical protein
MRGFPLAERAVDRPWVKDYDAVRGEDPTRWATRFDLTNWGLIAAHDGGRRVGGAVIACNTAGAHTLEGGSDLAVPWDIRVPPNAVPWGSGRCCFTPPRAGP